MAMISLRVLVLPVGSFIVEAKLYTLAARCSYGMGIDIHAEQIFAALGANATNQLDPPAPALLTIPTPAASVCSARRAVWPAALRHRPGLNHSDRNPALEARAHDTAESAAQLISANPRRVRLR